MALTYAILLVLVANSWAKIIDLSHDHGPNTFMAPGNMQFRREVNFSGIMVPGVFVQYGILVTGEHGGTHMDAPCHFDQNGQAIHQIPLESTILTGVMVDCTKEVAKNNSYAMSLQKLLDWEEEHGKIPPKAAIIVNFNWSSRFADPVAYTNSQTPDKFETHKYPIISAEAAEWLVDERDIGLLGADTLGPDYMQDNFPVHVKLLQNSRPIIENVKDPGRLPARGFRLHAAPVKFVGASGTQVRLYAMTFSEDGNRAHQSLVVSIILTCLGVLLAGFIA